MFAFAHMTTTNIELFIFIPSANTEGARRFPVATRHGSRLGESKVRYGRLLFIFLPKSCFSNARRYREQLAAINMMNLENSSLSES